MEQSSAEAKSLKLRAKGPSSCHPSGQQAARRGPEGRNKELLSQQFTKETELKVALAGSTVGQKEARQRKHNEK